MFDKQALFHDMTLDFIHPTQPSCGQEVTIKFRACRDDELMIYLCIDGQKILMDKYASDESFDYYKTVYTIGDKTVLYDFIVSDGDSTVIYDKRGPMNATGPWDMKFRIIPGFKVPRWAVGAVIYQIFTDRFCNGDKSNDVKTNEYFYNGEMARFRDWDEYPDPKIDYADFYGGDLQGVIDKLDYLKDLGIEAIYFNPLFVSPSSHKYDTQDYDHIDPHFGKIVRDEGHILAEGEKDNRKATKYISRVADKENLTASDQLFIKLIQEAHKRNIRIIMDGVFNHCGSFNKWLDKERIYESTDGYEKGAFVDRNSPYHDYFSFAGENWPYNGQYDGWWGYDTLPKLNYEGSKALEDYIIGIGKKWVSPPFNADGWRLDVAADLGHSLEYNHSFWKKFRKAVKQANPEAIILAEQYGDSRDWLGGDEWDTVMNYDAFMEPVTWFLTGMEKHSDEYKPEMVGDADYFYETMRYCGGRNFSTGPLYVAMNELSNHDHSRFLTRTSRHVGRTSYEDITAGDRDIDKAVMREAVVMQMTWPGAPTIYYGDEASVAGFTDPDNRRTYPWGHEDQEMISFHKDIIKIHKQFEELRTGSLKYLVGEKNVLAYGRFNKEAASIVIINNNDYEVTTDIAVWYLGIPKCAPLKKIITTDAAGYRLGTSTLYYAKNGLISVTLGSKSAVILRYDGDEAISREAFWKRNKLEI